MTDFFAFSDYEYFKTCMLSRIERVPSAKFQQAIAFQTPITRTLIESNYSKANSLLKTSDALSKSFISQHGYREIAEIPVKYIENIEKFEEFLIKIENSVQENLNYFFSKEKLAFCEKKRTIMLDSEKFPKIIGLFEFEDMKIEKVPNKRREAYFGAFKLKEKQKECQRFAWDFKFLIFYIENCSE